ncbi:MAG TPA: GAF domain-containing protein [Candidatus Sericytochromatia bacterium]
MVFWGDHTGEPSSYRGWKVLADTSKINTPSELDKFCKKLFQWLQVHMAVDTVTLLLPDSGNQDLTVRSTIGLEDEITQKVFIPIGKGFAGNIAENKLPVVVENLSVVEVVSPVLRGKGLQSMVGVPLQLVHSFVGVLHVGTFQPRKFNERDIQQLQLVGNLLQSVIANAGVYNFDQRCYSQATCSSWKDKYYQLVKMLLGNKQAQLLQYSIDY